MNRFSGLTDQSAAAGTMMKTVRRSSTAPAASAPSTKNAWNVRGTEASSRCRPRNANTAAAGAASKSRWPA